jgi:hypothetical protein
MGKQYQTRVAEASTLGLTIPAGRCRPRAAGGRPLAGLEFVEKLLTRHSKDRVFWLG